MELKLFIYEALNRFYPRKFFQNIFMLILLVYLRPLLSSSFLFLDWDFKGIFLSRKFFEKVKSSPGGFKGKFIIFRVWGESTESKVIESECHFAFEEGSGIIEL